MAKYKLKEGVVIHPNGAQTTIDNDNLTDAIAEHLIEAGKATNDDFETGDFAPVNPLSKLNKVELQAKYKELKNEDADEALTKAQLVEAIDAHTV